MVRRDCGLLRLLMKLGIQSARELYQQTSVLRSMYFKKLAQMAGDEPDELVGGWKA
jgi:hypothetical protein